MHFRVCSTALLIGCLWVPQLAQAENEGLAKLDEASTLKIGADTPTKLKAVITLCEEAITAGLDDDNLQLAKQILSASALQRAQLSLQQLPRVASNPNALRRLRNDASADIEKAIANNSKSAEAHLLYAQLQGLPGGDPDKALKSVDSAIELFKDKPKERSAAYLLRAGIRAEADEKLEDLQKAIESDPTNMNAWQARIIMLMGTQKFEEAYQDVERLLKQDSGNPFAIAAAVESLFHLKRYDDAINILTPRIEAKPTDGSLYRMRGQAYMEKDDMDKALADLDKAIELNKKDAQALLIRGELYFGKKEYEKANRDVNDAMAIEPNLVRGVLMRSMIAAQEKRYADAIADMELLVRANPSNEAAVRQLASYYQMDDRPRLAIRLLDQLIKDDPQNWRALRARGDARLSISEHAEAIRDYQKAIDSIQKEPSNAEEDRSDEIGLLNNLAWVLATSPKDEIRDGKRSIELGTKACELSEYKEAHILSTLAAGYAEVGDFEQALKWSSKAVEVGTEENNEQLDQLKKELESYKEKKPWREAQDVNENKKPLSSAVETIDT